jgi:23S rRNA pseudouridine2605 synthase
MFESLGYQVSRLIRIRFGGIVLPPRLTRGKWLEFKASEVTQLEEQCGLVPQDPTPQPVVKPAPRSSRDTRKTKSRPD